MGKDNAAWYFSVLSWRGRDLEENGAGKQAFALRVSYWVRQRYASFPKMGNVLWEVYHAEVVPATDF